MRRRQSTDLIVVHCSATPKDADIGVREINAWHKERGIFSEAGLSGYHYVIRRGEPAKIEAGRAVWAWGAHARGFNDRSVGVCLVGGARKAQAGEQPEWGKFVSDANFSISQYVSLVSLLEVLKLQYPDAVVVGHNELNDRKACPAFELLSFLGRDEAAQAKVTETIARIREERDA